jgi:Beta-lactamase
MRKQPFLELGDGNSRNHILGWVALALAAQPEVSRFVSGLDENFGETCEFLLRAVKILQRDDEIPVDAVGLRRDEFHDAGRGMLGATQTGRLAQIFAHRLSEPRRCERPWSSNQQGQSDAAVEAVERAREAILPLLKRRVKTGFAPGLVALVGESENAEIVTAGMSSLEGGERMGSDTLFRIASMTKPVTAAAAMMLVEEGKLVLDAPVDALLPELSNLKVLRRPNGPLDDTVPARLPITLEDILTYRLGTGILFGSPDEYPILAAINERRLAGFGPPLPDEDYGPDE